MTATVTTVKRGQCVSDSLVNSQPSSSASLQSMLLRSRDRSCRGGAGGKTMAHKMRFTLEPGPRETGKLNFAERPARLHRHGSGIVPNDHSNHQES